MRSSLTRSSCLAVVGLVLSVAGGCLAAPQATAPGVTTPTAQEVYEHEIAPAEPVRRAEERRRWRESVGVVLTVDETGRVIEARANPDQGDRPAPADVVAEALVHARAATYQPFQRNGVAQRVEFQTSVPVLGPERRPAAHRPFPETAGKAIAIGLSRSSCFGSCPDYSVTLLGDGTVTYTGRRYVAIEGRHVAHVSPAAVAALVEQFRRADFFSLDENYQAAVTDNPTQTVTLKIGDEIMTVADYVGLEDGMPFAVARLERAIDRAAGTATWVRGDERTVDLLAAEGWDFRSPDAGRALVVMADNGSDAAVLGLVRRGAPLNLRAEVGFEQDRTAVQVAAAQGRSNLVQAMIDAGALDTPERAEAALIAAARSLDPATLDAVMKTARFNRRQLGLALVAALNDGAWRDPQPEPRPVFERLMAARADVTVRDSEGRTALHGAFDADSVRRLLAAGAVLEAKDNYHGTPLTSAVDENVALALMDAGADVTAKPQYGSDLAEQAERNHWTRVQARLARR